MWLNLAQVAAERRRREAVELAIIAALNPVRNSPETYADSLYGYINVLNYSLLDREKIRLMQHKRSAEKIESVHGMSIDSEEFKSALANTIEGLRARRKRNRQKQGKPRG